MLVASSAGIDQPSSARFQRLNCLNPRPLPPLFIRVIAGRVGDLSGYPLASQFANAASEFQERESRANFHSLGCLSELSGPETSGGRRNARPRSGEEEEARRRWSGTRKRRLIDVGRCPRDTFSPTKQKRRKKGKGMAQKDDEEVAEACRKLIGAPLCKRSGASVCAAEGSGRWFAPQRRRRTVSAVLIKIITVSVVAARRPNRNLIRDLINAVGRRSGQATSRATGSSETTVRLSLFAALFRWPLRNASSSGP